MIVETFNLFRESASNFADWRNRIVLAWRGNYVATRKFTLKQANSNAFKHRFISDYEASNKSHEFNGRHTHQWKLNVDALVTWCVCIETTDIRVKRFLGLETCRSNPLSGMDFCLPLEYFGTFSYESLILFGDVGPRSASFPVCFTLIRYKDLLYWSSEMADFSNLNRIFFANYNKYIHQFSIHYTFDLRIFKFE